MNSERTLHCKSSTNISCNPNLFFGLLFTILILLTPITKATADTIFYEGFEYAFPGSWNVGNNNSTTVSKWGDNSAKAYAGGWSAFCADNGSNSRTTYDNNLNTYMQRRNVSLVGYATATLTFKYWQNTETYYDGFEVNVKKQNGTWVNKLSQYSPGNSSGWKTKTINMNEFCGQSNLTIGFDFVSDESVVPSSSAGVWIDEVSLTAEPAPGSITATLKNQNGTNSSGSKTKFLLYPGIVPKVGNNPATYTGLAPRSSSDPYWVEGYQNGPFNEYEYWGSVGVAVNAGQSVSATVNRNTPYCENFWFDYYGIPLSSLFYIPVGATVTPKVSIRNKDTNSSRSVYTSIGWRSGSSGSAIGTKQSSTVTVGANSTVTITLPSVTFTSDTKGDIYAYVKTYSSFSNWALTDSWDWTKMFAVDGTSPTKPGTPDLAAADDTGKYNYDNITKNTSGLTFSWSASSDSQSGISYYEYKLDSGSWTNIGNVTSKDISAGNGTHTFYVRAKDNCGNYSSSSSLAFEVDTVAPLPPTFISPSEWEEIGDTTPELEWQAVSNAWKYQVRINELSLPFTDNRDSGEITSTTWTVSPALGIKNWFWAVKVWDIAGNEGSYGKNGVVGDVGSFTVYKIVQISDVPFYFQDDYTQWNEGGICTATAGADILGFWDRTVYSNGILYWNLVDNGIAPIIDFGDGHVGNQGNIEAVVDYIGEQYYIVDTTDKGKRNAYLSFANNINNLQFEVTLYDTFTLKSTKWEILKEEIDAGRPVSWGVNLGAGGHTMPVKGYLEGAELTDAFANINGWYGYSDEWIDWYGNDSYDVDTDDLITLHPGGTPIDHYESDDQSNQAQTIEPTDKYNFRQTHNFYNTSDTDWMKFSAQAGKKYIIESKNLGSQASTRVYLYKEGNLSTPYSKDSDGGTAKVVVGSLQPQTFYIWATNANGNSGPHTNYDIEVDYEDITITALSSGTNFPGGIDSGDWKFHSINVPSGVQNLNVKTEYATGDVDIYVSKSDLPSSESGYYNASATTSSGNENVTISTPSAGTYYIGVYGKNSAGYFITATNNFISKPVVSIVATDTSAGEPANNGYFTVSRTGSASTSLRVYYGTSGSTATSGSDYAALPGYVDISSGQSSALISVVVIDDSKDENSETVKVTLSSNSSYDIDAAHSYDSVIIADNDSGSVPPGSLQVTLGPAGAVSSGAQWNVDGGSWRNSGSTVSGLSVGSYNVNYKSITGWLAPTNEQVQVNSDQTTAITRNYTQQYNLTTNVVDGNGTISSGGSYASGTQVTVTATPNSGYKVKAWRGTDDESSTSTTNTVTMSGNKTVTVEFELIQVVNPPVITSITPTSGPAGSYVRIEGSEFGDTAGNVDFGGTDSNDIVSWSDTEIFCKVPDVNIEGSGIVDNGLVAWYPFTGNANDMSGNGNNGTVSGAQLTEDRFGNPNQAYLFDGVDDVIEAPHSESLDLTGPITLSAWIKSDSTYYYSGIITKVADYMPTVGYQLHTTNNEAVASLAYSTGGSSHYGGSVVSDTTVIDGKWHLLTATYNGSEMRMYIDGQLENSVPYSDDYDSTTAPLKIGYRYYPYNDGHEGNHNWALNGAIDDVRIYSRALSSNEIAGLYEESDPDLEKGLISYYKLDETSGDVIDSQGSNTGINHGAIRGQEGVVNNCFQFDGGLVDCGDDISLNTPQMSASVWFKSDINDIYQILMGKFSNGTGVGWTIKLRDTGKIWFVVGDVWTFNEHVESTVTFSPNVWHHLVVTYDSNKEAIIYLDNIERGRGTLTQTLNAPTVNLQLGNDETTVMEHYDGFMDEVRIYDRALLASEVNLLFQEGTVIQSSMLAGQYIDELSGIDLENGFSLKVMNETPDGNDTFSIQKFNSLSEFTDFMQAEILEVPVSIQREDNAISNSLNFTITTPDTIYVDISNTSGMENGTAEYPFSTIQRGIEAASEGATVIVAEGTYYENINFNGKAITLKSTNPNDPAIVGSTIINGSQNGSVVTFYNHEESSSIIDGFTITEGTGTSIAIGSPGGGIFCNYSSPVIKNCIFINNNSPECGGGIACYTSSPTIIHCIFYSNSAQYGGGIYCVDNANPVVTNTIIANNGNGPYGSGIYCDFDSTISLENCTIVNNSNGVYCYTSGNANIINSILWNNGDDLYGCSATYSCIEDGDSGTGNISTYPNFVDAANGDFHLLPNSSCIDAGDPSSKFGMEPEPDGGRINMGAYGNTPEATSKGGLVLASYNLVGTPTRVGRTSFDYTYTMTLLNSSGLDVSNVQVALMAVPGNMTLIDSDVTFSYIESLNTAVSDDTFTIRVDAATSIDTSSISWKADFDWVEP